MEVSFDTQELDIKYVKACIQLVLDKCHTHPDKKVIDDRKSDRLNIACPICGDSHKRTKTKRGWLFLNSLTYKCYNEGCRSSFTDLCKLGSVNLDPEKKLQLMEYASSNMKLKPREDEFQSIVQSELLSLKKMEELFNSGLGKFTEFKPIEKGSQAYKYLISRKMFDHTNIYECNHWITDKWSEYSIVFLNRKGDLVLGLQTRNLKESKEKRRFKIYNFKELLEMVEPQKEMLEEELEYLNKLSYFYNILNVDFERKITILEGFTDAYFYPNSMGMVGLNTDYNFLLGNNLDIQFLFDNDDTGKRKTLMNIEKGLSCFLWKKLFEKIASEQKDPQTAFVNLNLKIKDLNKLAQFFNNPFSSLNLDNYYSKDSFDKMYVQVDRYVKKDLKKDIKNQNFRR